MRRAAATIVRGSIQSGKLVDGGSYRGIPSWLPGADVNTAQRRYQIAWPADAGRAGCSSAWFTQSNSSQGLEPSTVRFRTDLLQVPVRRVDRPTPTTRPRVRRRLSAAESAPDPRRGGSYCQVEIRWTTFEGSMNRPMTRPITIHRESVRTRRMATPPPIRAELCCNQGIDYLKLYPGTGALPRLARSSSRTANVASH